MSNYMLDRPCDTCGRPFDDHPFEITPGQMHEFTYPPRSSCDDGRGGCTSLRWRGQCDHPPAPESEDMARVIANVLYHFRYPRATGDVGERDHPSQGKFWREADAILTRLRANK